MSPLMEDSVKVKLDTRLLSHRIFMTLIFGIFIVIGLLGSAQYSFHGTALSVQGQRCKLIKNDGFCNAVNSYLKYCKFINSEAVCNVASDYFRKKPGDRVRKSNNLLIVDTPGISDTFTETYDINTGELTKICGFWIGFHTQKGPCVEGDELDAYLDKVKKARSKRNGD